MLKGLGALRTEKQADKTAPADRAGPGGAQQAQARAPKGKLPIHEHMERLLEHIRTNRVTCILGETGCGKSTQVPEERGRLQPVFKSAGAQKSDNP